jgi:hypothetical protein
MWPGGLSVRVEIHRNAVCLRADGGADRARGRADDGCHFLCAIGVYREGEASEYQSMPKLPDMSAAAVKKRQAMTKAAELARSKEPVPVPVVKIRMAKPR